MIEIARHRDDPGTDVFGYARRQLLLELRLVLSARKWLRRTAFRRGHEYGKLASVLPINEMAWRRSTIANVQMKSGKSGRLGLVTVRYEIGVGSTTAIVDEQEIVYREPAPIRAAPSDRSSEPENVLVSRWMRADPVLLFRYSALTFNGHRIHYDRSYATQDEQYPGLVVHGPLLATQMVRAAMEVRPTMQLKSFSFRAQSPIFDVDEFRVGASASIASPDEIETWIVDHRGQRAFKGMAMFESR